MHSGFGDMGAKHFSSAVSHVHPVYMAYILLHSGLPGVSADNDTIIEKQGKVRQILKNRETAYIINE